LLKVSRRFGGTYRFHLQDRRISRARHQRESRWQAASVDFQRATRLYTPEDSTLQDHLCENLKSYKFITYLHTYSKANNKVNKSNERNKFRNTIIAHTPIIMG
jgi:hypothetical protein